MSIFSPTLCSKRPPGVPAGIQASGKMATIAVVPGARATVDTEEPSSKSTFNVGSRKSKLALIQTNIVVNALAAACPQHVFTIKARDTAAGDIDKLTPFKDMPVKNLWTHELETLMVEGQLDFLVHSLKGCISLWLDRLAWLTSSRCSNTVASRL